MALSLRYHVKNIRRALKRSLRNRRNARRKAFHDFDDAVIDTIGRVSAYTQTSWQKIYGLVRATEYVVENDVPGSFVECGVWRGGSMMAVALTLQRLGVRDRDLHLFDTFAGLPEPGEKDVDYKGEDARETWARWGGEGEASDWCRATLNEVERTMARSGYPLDRVHYGVGLVEKTIPEQAPAEIALLRLDTDWYESTLHEMVHLYPRLAVGGVLIVDDYGTWQGARKAVDEYVREHKIPLLLNRLDAGARVAVKLES
jgi:O-methyltransferase